MSVTSQSTAPVEVARTRVAPIALAGGWRGSLFRSEENAAKTGALDPSRLTPEQWRSILEQLTENPDAFPGHAVLKYAADAEIIRVQPQVQGTAIDLVCRRSQSRGLLRYIRNRLGLGRNHAIVSGAQSLHQAGINTARPLALIESSGVSFDAWLVMEYVPNVVDLDQVALRLLPRVATHRHRRIKDALLATIVECFVALERSGLAHRDLKASNILLGNWSFDSSPPTVWILDLEGLRRSSRRREARRLKPLMRLASSLLGYASVTRTDHARFLMAYLESVGEQEPRWRPLYRQLAGEAGEYGQRSRSRKTHKLDGYVEDTHHGS